MIELKHMSTLPIIGGYKFKKSPDVSNINAGLIKQYYIKDYEKLKDFYNHTGEYANLDYRLDENDNLGRIITSMEGCLKQKDKFELKPSVYPNHEMLSFSGTHYIDEADSNVSTRKLLYGTPFEFGTNKACYEKYGYKRVKTNLPSNIYLLRQMLSHCTTNGVNLLKKYYGLSTKDIYRVLEALRMYNEQLSRQWLCNNIIGRENGKDLFYLDKDEKYKLLEVQYKYIAEYLTYHFPHVWGGYSEKEQRAIWDSYHKNTPEAKNDKKKVLDFVSDYISLDEAYPISEKTLSRFTRHQ